MAKSFDEVKAEIDAANQLLSSFLSSFPPVVDNILALTKEDPCAEGFAAKLDEADAAAGAENDKIKAIYAAIVNLTQISRLHMIVGLEFQLGNLTN